MPPSHQKGRASGRARCDELLRVEVGIAEGQVDRRQPFEVVTDDQLIRHSHTAVDLYCLLADEPTRLADHDLGG